MISLIVVKAFLGWRIDKNNGRDPSGEFTLPFSASLQWLCPSTREEEEVIDSHNPNSLMVAELRKVYNKLPTHGTRHSAKVKYCYDTVSIN